MDDSFYCGKGKVLFHAAVMDGAGSVLSAPRSTGGSKCAATFLKHFYATADAKPDREISAKLDHIVELTQKVAARKAAPIPSVPGVRSVSEMASSPGPSAAQMAARWQSAYEARAARVCAESEAAYAARNPHKKERNSNG